MGIKEIISKLNTAYRKYGFIGFFKRLYAYIVANWLDTISFRVALNARGYSRQLKRILNECRYDRIILWRSSFGYDVSLFQRPQHIAGNLASQGCLVFYEVTTMTDGIKTYKKQSDNLYLFNFNNKPLRALLMKELDGTGTKKFVQLYSTDWKLSVADIEDYISRGFGFIYEYIDHISPELAGTAELPKNISEKYEYVMSHPEVFVAVTADVLKEDVIAHRGEVNLAYSTNGVDYTFMRSYDVEFDFDPDFKKILSAGKPVVCYYGAMASWLDYTLIKRIAATGRFSVVLFGIKYDDSLELNMGDGVENVYFLGPRKYEILKNYAACADILIIPFIINDITRATNPVKLFEYMALHKPIVTTDMNECRKYRSVMTAHDHDEFLALLDRAMDMRDNEEYIALLDEEARANDWSEKARAIVDMIS